MLAVVNSDNCRIEHGMIEPAYGANLFIFWWLFSLVQVCGQKAAKYFRRIKFRSWTVSFKHLLPLSSQKKAEKSPEGISGPNSNQETPTVIIEDTQPLNDPNCNCVVCATTSDDEFSPSHSYSSSCSSCSPSSSSSSLSYSDGEEVEVEEAEEAVEEGGEREDDEEELIEELEHEDEEERKENVDKITDLLIAATAAIEEEQLRTETENNKINVEVKEDMEKVRSTIILEEIKEEEEEEEEEEEQEQEQEQEEQEQEQQEQQEQQQEEQEEEQEQEQEQEQDNVLTKKVVREVEIKDEERNCQEDEKNKNKKNIIPNIKENEETFQKVREMIKMGVNKEKEQEQEKEKEKEKEKEQERLEATEIKTEEQIEEKIEEVKKRANNDNKEEKSDKVKHERRKEITKEEIKKEERKTTMDENKKEDEISFPPLAPKVSKLSAYSQFTKIPPAPPNSPKERHNKSRVKELATWFEEKVIVRPEQVSVKKPEIPPKPKFTSSKTYDSNNNKRVVGGLVSFFCSQNSPRPRQQPISESRVNVMNLIETFEKRAENNSRYYPFIPLHVEHFV